MICRNTFTMLLLEIILFSWKNTLVKFSKNHKSGTKGLNFKHKNPDVVQLFIFQKNYLPKIFKQKQRADLEF